MFVPPKGGFWGSDAGNICLHIPFILLCMFISAFNSLWLISTPSLMLSKKLLTCSVLVLVALKLQVMRNLTAGDLRHGQDGLAWDHEQVQPSGDRILTSCTLSGGWNQKDVTALGVWSFVILKLPLNKASCISCLWASNKKSSGKPLAKVFGDHILWAGHTFCREPARMHPAGLRWRKTLF